MKLIRDNYKDIISKERIRNANDSEKFDLLKNKIIEELNELQETNFNDLDEWADVFETIFAMMSFKNIDYKQIETHRINKKLQRGGFNDFLVLLNN